MKIPYEYVEYYAFAMAYCLVLIGAIIVVMWNFLEDVFKNRKNKK